MKQKAMAPAEAGVGRRQHEIQAMGDVTVSFNELTPEQRQAGLEKAKETRSGSRRPEKRANIPRRGDGSR